MSTTIQAPTAPPTTVIRPTPPPERAAPPPGPGTAQKGPVPPAGAQPPKPKGADPAKVEGDLRQKAKDLWKSPAAAPAPDPAAAPAPDPKAAAPAPTPDPKAAAAPPAAPAPDAGEDLFAHVKPPEGMSDAAMSGWKALKAETSKKVKETQAEAAALKAKLETLEKAAPAGTAEIDGLKAEHAAMKDRMAVLDLENHPDFARQYALPKQKALEEAKTVLLDNGIAEIPDFGLLLGKPRAEFAKVVSELAAKLPAFDQSAFATAMREAFRLTGESKQALSKASELRAGMEAQAAAQQKAAFGEVWGKLGDADTFLKPVDIPDTASSEEKAELGSYNKAVAEVRSKAEANAFGRLDAKGAAALASKSAVLDFMVGVAVPRMNKEYASVLADRNRLAAELKAIHDAKNPGSFSGAAPAAAAPGAAPAPGSKPRPMRDQLSEMYKTGVYRP